MDQTFVYPAGTVLDLLKSPAVTPATRRALQDRLAPEKNAPRFFEREEFDRLQQVCARLLAQTDTPVAALIDHRLADGRSNGWRYDVLPTDGETFRMGLKGIEESAQLMHQTPFEQLSADQQDQLFRAIQQDEAPGETWQQLPADRFFEELLVEVVELFYSHPLVQEEIGYVGMADAPGWQRLGLNERELREPEAQPFSLPDQPTPDAR